jgi:hypothetical protein
LAGDPIALILSRRTENHMPAFNGFPSLDLRGLTEIDAHTLLNRTVTRRLEPRIADQIVTATAGNPLAIIDLSQELSTHQLVGLTLLPEPLPVGSHLQTHYLQRTRELPEPLQLWLLLAAAEPTGDPGILAAASAVLGISVQAMDVAEANNLVRIAGKKWSSGTHWCARPSTAAPPDHSAAACTTRWPRSSDATGTSTGGPGISQLAVSVRTTTLRKCSNRLPNAPENAVVILHARLFWPVLWSCHPMAGRASTAPWWQRKRL